MNRTDERLTHPQMSGTIRNLVLTPHGLLPLTRKNPWPRSKNHSGRPRANSSAKLWARTPDLDYHQVNQKWTKAGHEGQISDALYYVVRRKMGIQTVWAWVKEPEPRPAPHSTSDSGKKETRVPRRQAPHNPPAPKTSTSSRSPFWASSLPSGGVSRLRTVASTC